MPLATPQVPLELRLVNTIINTSTSTMQVKV